MNLVLVYITCPSQDLALSITKELLARRLIACANFMPVTTICRWEGAVEESKEVILLCKTRAELCDKITSEVEKLHPYKIPAILTIPISANHAFAQWVKDETTQS